MIALSKWSTFKSYLFPFVFLPSCQIDFFATMNKERNPPYLQIRRRLNGKLWCWGLFIPKVHAYSCNSCEKKNQHVKRLGFCEILSNKCILKIVHSKSPVRGLAPKFVLLHQYKIVPSVYKKRKHLSGPQIPKCEANLNYLPKSPPHPSSMKQCNKSDTVKFHMELLLILRPGRNLALMRHQLTARHDSSSNTVWWHCKQLSLITHHSKEHS